MYRAVIFDLDGTLLNTLDDLTAAANHALAALGLPGHTRQEICGFVGDGIPMLIRRMLPQPPSPALIDAAGRQFSSYYAAHRLDATAPYPGIPALLGALREGGVKLAVLSNKAHDMTLPIIRHFFPGCFDAVQGLEEGMPPKPDPAGARRLLAQLACPPQQVLYVGDSDTDMRTAAAAGLASCGVLWGFRSRAVLAGAGAQWLCADTQALQRLILQGAA